MSDTRTVHPTRDTRQGAVDPGLRLTPLRLLRSELLRFVTVRSNVVTLAAVAAVMVLIGVVAAATATGDVEGVGPGGAPAPGFSGTDPLTTVLAGQTPGVLVVGILGVLVGAREYGSGMIRTTIAAAPRRTGVLLARVGAFVLAVLPVVLVSTVAAWGVGSAVLEAGDVEVAAWSDPGVPRAVLGTGLYLTAIGVLGVCLGTLTRSIGQGIGWLVGLVLVVPGFGALLLPDDWQDALRYLPSTAGSAFTTITSSPDRLDPGAGALVLTAWLLAGVVGALTALLRRDV
jgi:ABC-2 type transport system permease protein